MPGNSGQVAGKVIGIDATSAMAQGGGIGRFTRGLLEGLSRVDSEFRYLVGYAKDVGDAPRPMLPAHIRWRRFPLSQKQLAWLWYRLRLPIPAELLLGEGMHLYHSPDYTLPPLLHARSIVTIHDLSFETMPEVHEPALRRYLQRAVPPSIARADHIFADSKSTKQEIIAHYGVPPETISVVYPGVEPRFRPYRAENAEDATHLAQVRERYALEGSILLNVATLEPRKNHATLIRAFAQLSRRQPGRYTLAIAGGGGWLGQREAIEALVSDLGIGESVRLLGFVPDELLPALLNVATLLVYPSLYEGFGLPVLEALACGVPVVTARNSSLPEAGGNAAHYIEDATDVEELAWCMESVLDSEEMRARMIRAGLQHAAQFTWEKAASDAIALYRKVLVR